MDTAPKNLAELPGLLAFLKRAENLKNTLRHSWTSTGRPESAAEHSWRLCLMVLLFTLDGQGGGADGAKAEDGGTDTPGLAAWPGQAAAPWGEDGANGFDGPDCADGFDGADCTRGTDSADCGRGGRREARPRTPDPARALCMAVLHDLAEAICGDTPAMDLAGREHKAARERAALVDLLSPLPERLRRSLFDLWQEYEAGTSEEAGLVKALDKLETLIQHNQGRNPQDFDYRFNLGYGTEYTGHDGMTAALRAMIDRETRARIAPQTASEES